MKGIPVGVLAGVSALLAMISMSCGNTFEPVCAGCPPPYNGNDYAELSAPESLVVNLQASYRRRDIGKYSELLASDFIFRFQPIDQPEHGEFWTRDQDSTGTDALFRSSLVSGIRIDLRHGPAEDPAESGFDPDVQKIQIHLVQLEVDLTDGITLLVTDLQDMYFRPGREAMGEDPDRWYLLEWRDIPSAASPGIRAIESTSWGSIKARFSAGLPG